MAGIAIKHQFRANVERFLTKVKAAAEDSAVEAAKIVGEQIVHDAQQQLIEDGHVKTGALLDSIHYEVDKPYGEGTEIQVVLRVTADATNGNGQPYGGIIEATDPFVIPAVYDHLHEYGVEFQALFQDYMQNS